MVLWVISDKPNYIIPFSSPEEADRITIFAVKTYHKNVLLCDIITDSQVIILSEYICLQSINAASRSCI